jgi:rare lipoprotein A
MKPYQVNGVWYEPREDPNYDEVGYASWYGEAFHNRRTANGELFDMDVASAAHKTLPLPSLVDVTNLESGRTIRLRVNDRGPFVAGRIIDLSREAARELGVYQKGLARVRVRYVGPADRARPEDGLRYAQASPPAPAASPPPRHPTVRIQAAAFADRANADRAAARLAREGEPFIEPLARGEVTLWRVVVACDGEDALARITAAGFPEAHLVQP